MSYPLVMRIAILSFTDGRPKGYISPYLLLLGLNKYVEFFSIYFRDLERAIHGNGFGVGRLICLKI